MPTSPTVPAALRAGASTVARLLATPLVPDDYLDLLDPLRSGTTLRARILAVQPETPDAVTLVLQTGRGWTGHLPGQWVRLGVDVDGIRQWRAYSLTGPPRPDGRISLTVQATPDGRVSTFLVRRARPGMLLRLDQAAGSFVLPTTPPARVLFVTAGSGITPVMGMLRSALDHLTDAVVLHSAPSSDRVIFGNELRNLAAAGRIRLLERHTGTDGRLAPAELDHLVPDWRDRQCWACGPVALLDALEEHWSAVGRADQLQVERFRPVLTPVGDGGAVTFGRSGITVEADAATPLLNAGERAGVLMPSGCRMGVCFGCVTPLRAGSVRDLRSGEITSASDGGHVLVQTCISAAAGACSLDL